jgi:hypothetical protein
MPQGWNCPQSHCLCHFGLGAPQTSRQRDQADGVSPQTGVVVRLPPTATQVACHSNDFCLSPNFFKYQTFELATWVKKIKLINTTNNFDGWTTKYK